MPKKAKQLTVRSLRRPLKEIAFGDGGRAPTLVFDNGEKGIGGCVGCLDTPCAQKQADELTMHAPMDAFPGNPSRDVCPTQAIHWDEKSAAIVIDDSRCIGCGLCIVRCPYGALYTTGEKAKVLPPTSSLLREETGEEHPSAPRRGVIALPNAPALGTLPRALTSAGVDATLLVRNALHEIGISCRTRRRGDTNVRIDAVARFADSKIAAIELEFGNAALESPRALLEDLAVLHSRYGVEVESAYAISVLLALPNVRSEYYRVIDDIKVVLGIDCRTITVAVLLLMAWTFTKVRGLGSGEFITKEGDVDLSRFLKVNDRVVLRADPYQGALRPAK